MKKAPKWFDNTYGHDAAAWEEARRQCREVLIGWARRGHVGTYSELANEVDAIAWPEGAYTHHGGQIGWLLGQVSVEEWLEDRPLLSALSILKGDNRPSYGFFDLCDNHLGIHTGATAEAKDAYWLTEVNRCHEYWKNH